MEYFRLIFVIPCFLKLLWIILNETLYTSKMFFINLLLYFPNYFCERRTMWIQILICAQFINFCSVKGLYIVIKWHNYINNWYFLLEFVFLVTQYLKSFIVVLSPKKGENKHSKSVCRYSTITRVTYFFRSEKRVLHPGLICFSRNAFVMIKIENKIRLGVIGTW